MGRVAPKPIVTTFHCVECGRAWEEPRERWRLKVLIEDDRPPETVPYCPACHAREFE